MKDMQNHLEKLRAQASECQLICDLATDPEKRALFAKLADHFKALASEVEKAIQAKTVQPRVLGAQEPSSEESRGE